MKKTLLILSFLFASIFCSNAQTKEETIYWVKEYGFDMLGNYNSSFTDKYEINKNGIKLTTKHNVTNSFNSETYMSFDCLGKMYLEGIEISSSGDADNSLVLELNEECIHSKSTNYQGGFSSDSWDSLYFDFKNSTSREDQERFLKAIKHLATLCGAKEKPKVTKKTF
jgi:hypothetical protein